MPWSSDHITGGNNNDDHESSPYSRAASLPLAADGADAWSFQVIWPVARSYVATGEPVPNMVSGHKVPFWFLAQAIYHGPVGFMMLPLSRLKQRLMGRR